MKKIIFQFIIKAHLYIFGRQLFQKFNHSIIRFSLRSIGVLNYSDYTQSGEENFIKNTLNNLIKNKKKPIFIDGGANNGSYSKNLLIKYFPNAVVYAFEPNPTSFKELSQTKANIHAINKALGQDCKLSLLFEPFNNPGSTHCSLHQPMNALGNQIQVECTTLDIFCSENSIEHIDFLKLDLEGNELETMRGASTLIKAGKITCIQFEFNEINYTANITMQDIITALPGYKLYRMLPKGLTPLPNTAYLENIYAYQNIVAIFE